MMCLETKPTQKYHWNLCSQCVSSVHTH